jgi:hypothetical protein
LRAVGTEAAVRALIQILRDVKPSRVSQYGFIASDDQGDDVGVAHTILHIPGGPKLAKELLRPEEFELMILAGRTWDDDPCPQIMQALEEFGTKPAVAGLVSYLSSEHTSTETRQRAQAVLERLGSRAHPVLLHQLGRRGMRKPEHQIMYWSDMLQVLEKTGDAGCVETIKNLMTLGPEMSPTAKRCLRSIARRNRKVSRSFAARFFQSIRDILPSPRTLRPMPIKAIARTGIAFVDDCFGIPWPEFSELRSWSTIQEGPGIQTMRQSGDLSGVLQSLGKLRKRLPDWWGSYYVAASILAQQGRFSDARAEVFRGLEKSRSKFLLCSRMAELEFQPGHLPAAVQWWIRSIVIQVSVHSCTDCDPSLYLATIARMLSQTQAQAKLERLCDASGGKGIILSDEYASRVRELLSAQNNDLIIRALVLLQREYLQNY